MMGIDLRALLAEEEEESGELLVVSEEGKESGRSGECLVVSEEGGEDVCAGERVRIVLELMPDGDVLKRPVRGTMGVAGQLPVFIEGGVSFGEVAGVLEALYRTFCDQYVPPDEGVVMDEGKVLAAVALDEGDGETLALF